MGFGSYDESEQETQDADGSEIEIADDDRGDYEGTVEAESDKTTDELVDQLQEIKDG